MLAKDEENTFVFHETHIKCVHDGKKTPEFVKNHTYFVRLFDS